MLARYLRELSKPVRYASPYHDPASLQALMNFLAINTRADSLPRMIHAPGVDEIHRQHPRIGAALRDFMQGHHPADMAAYIDMMQEAGHHVVPHQEDSLRVPRHLWPLASLLEMHDEMTRGGGDAGANPDILRQYQSAHMLNQPMRRTVLEGLHTPTGSMRPIDRITEMLASMRQLNHPNTGRVDDHLRHASLGSPHAVVGLHDLAYQLLHDPSVPPRTGTWGGGVEADTQHILGAYVRPHLRRL